MIDEELFWEKDFNPPKVAKKIIERAKEYYRDSGLKSIKIFKVKGERSFARNVIFENANIHQLEKLRYIVVIEYKENVKCFFFSTEGLHIGKKSFEIEPKIFKSISVGSITIFNQIRDVKKIYNIIFAILLYVSLVVDLAEWAFSVGENIITTFFIITVFLMLFPSYYLLYSITKRLSRDRQYFFQFTYFMGIKLFLFFFGRMLTISGVIFIISIAFLAFPATWAVLKRIRRRSTLKRKLLEKILDYGGAVAIYIGITLYVVIIIVDQYTTCVVTGLTIAFLSTISPWLVMWRLIIFLRRKVKDGSSDKMKLVITFICFTIFIILWFVVSLIWLIGVFTGRVYCER
ncbi:hypothetical protein LCGC14_0989250 [marine sediment metagenome]|uniref:Uncharacterized protein n=1 Tax=marine sediment metagenome TaxID=412755 RepID=A0A0F9NSZ3_9ZZZZ